MKINFKKTFLKSFEKLDKKIQTKTEKRINIFRCDPFEKSLRNHALLGKYSGYRSIDITGDYRAIFQEDSDGTYAFVDFVEIGTHSQLYG